MVIKVSCITAIRKEPVKMFEFENHVEEMHVNENTGFTLEYSVKLVVYFLFAVLCDLDVSSCWEEKQINITSLQQN